MLITEIDTEVKPLTIKQKKSKQTLESAQYRLEVIFKYGREKRCKNGNVDGNRFPRKPIVEYASIVSNRISTDRYWIIKMSKSAISWFS